jgi:CheY-like chemotaxis protein
MSADETLPRTQAADGSPLLRELGRARALGARSRELIGRVADLRQELKQAVAVLARRRRECVERRAGARPCVLVADDDAAVRTLLGLALRQAGFTHHLAANGREAVDLFRRHRGEVGLVLLDVRMPVLDGPGALAEIRTLDPAVPCCFMTGFAGGYCGEDLLGLGAVRVFEKPFHLDELVAVLGRLSGLIAGLPARWR